MNKNYDVRDDFEDGNEGFKYPGRSGRRRPGEPCLCTGQCIDDLGNGPIDKKQFRVGFDEAIILVYKNFDL